MKKVFLLSITALFVTMCFSQSVDPVLVTIGNKKITKSEFEYFWKKNNLNDNAQALSKEAYLDMFVTFKQKVAEAEAQGIDKISNFKMEFDEYRKQLSEPYFKDTMFVFKLKQELYNRFRTYVEFSQIQVNSPINSAPEDTLIQFQKAQNLYSRIYNGERFEKIARENSDDVTSKMQNGYIGTVVGLNMPFSLENALFFMKKDSVSPIVRSDIGYHILKLHSRRPVGDRFSAAHIMKAVPQNATKQEKAAAKDSIFKIYKALQKGGDFTYYATNNSDDKTAVENGGKYGLIECGIFPYVYDSVVHTLKVGSYSAPFQSKFGWHIVKALEFKPYEPFEFYNESLTKYVEKNETMQSFINRVFVENLLKDYNFSLNPESERKLMDAYYDYFMIHDSLKVALLSISNDTLFALKGKFYPIKMFQSYLSAHPEATYSIVNSFYDFLHDLVLKIEDESLETKYPEFGQLMQEYRDGMLLFEVSNKEIWDKSSKDTKGLQAYFDANKKKYAWEKPHYKGALIRCTNNDVAKKVKKALGKIPADSISVVLNRTFNNDSVSVVMAEPGLFEMGGNAWVDYLAFKQKQPEADKKYPVAFLKGKVLKAPESYSDVMGKIVMDYQNWLEENWVKSLREKYPVVVNKDVLNTVNNN